MLINILFVFINLTIIFFAYLIIKNRIEKKVINKDIISDIKKEINSMIIQLNETTLNNISLIEDKIKSLDSKIVLADKKNAGLKTSLTKHEDNTYNLFDKIDQNISYSPQKVVKQSKKTAENHKNDIKSEKNNEIDEKIKDMAVIDKATFLIKMGWGLEEVKKKTGLSSGELELLINIEDNNIFETI